MTKLNFKFKESIVNLKLLLMWKDGNYMYESQIIPKRLMYSSYRFFDNVTLRIFDEIKGCVF
jgi:hypothetical protein